jgi:hypothetical protein
VQPSHTRLRCLKEENNVAGIVDPGHSLYSGSSFAALIILVLQRFQMGCG